MIETIIILGIVAMMGGAFSILLSGMSVNKTVKVSNIVDATPTVYKPFSIDSNTGIIEMMPARKRISTKL